MVAVTGSPVFTGLVEMWGFQLSSVGLRVRLGTSPTFDQWLKLGEYLRWMEVSIQWLIGDYITYGEQHFGEKMSQALDATGWQPETVKQYAWVAEKIPSVRREPSLSFSHHREVADLEPKAQTVWLKKAAAGEDGQPWPVQRLRREINAVKHPEQLTVWLLVSCASDTDRSSLIARMLSEGRSTKVP